MTKSEKGKLKKVWRWLVAKTEEFQERSKSPDASSNGSHFDSGHASAFIMTRTELEREFYPLLDDYQANKSTT